MSLSFPSDEEILSACDDIDRLPIVKGFLRSIYEVDREKNPSAINSMSIRQYEEKLAEIKDCNCIQLWRILEDQTVTIKWRAVVTISKEQQIHIKFIRPEKLNSSCHFYRRFGSNRFLSVVVQGDLHSDCVSEQSRLFENGIRFGDMLFKFLCGKSISKKKTAPKIDGKYSAFESYFFAVKASPDISLYSFEEMSIETVYAELGDFSSETNMAKMNTRLMLGFSSTCFCSSVLGESITVTKDLYSADGNIMTDGCGFIHSSLVDSVPFAISSGVSRYYSPCGEYSRKRMGQHLPLILQVRLVCHLGLFKGCLIVTSDESLCKANSVVLRHSMLKRESVAGRYNENSLVHIAVCNTFENEVARYEQIPYGRLNRSFILLFECLCDPLSKVDQIFFELLDGDLSDVSFAGYDREKAKLLLSRFTSPMTSSFADSLFSEDDEDCSESGGVLYDEDIVNTEFHPNLAMKEHSQNKNRKYLEAIEMINAGFDLDEPHLQQVISDAIALYYNKLKEMRLSMQHCMYAVGAPDPFGDHVGEELQGELREGEVFIVHPRDRSSRLIIEEGDVVVTRNPATHPGDVRKLKAVRNSRLEALVEPTSCGIIFFSVEGKRSAADMMGGGDFDGDEYFIMLFKNRLVPLITEVEPFKETLKSQIRKNPIRGDRGFLIMRGLCAEASTCLVGKHYNNWLALADKDGPKSDSAKKHDHKYKIALDASKSGVYLSPPDKSIPQPHYMESSNQKTCESSSIIGKLYDRIVKEMNGQVSYLRKSIKLDCDTLVSISAVSEEEHFCSNSFSFYKKKAYEIINPNSSCVDLYSELINQSRTSFDDRCVQLAKLHTSSFLKGSILLFVCQGHLAASLYTITYKEANWNNHTQKYSISFCWEVCSRRLIEIKSIYKSHDDVDTLICNQNSKYTPFIRLQHSSVSPLRNALEQNVSELDEEIVYICENGPIIKSFLRSIYELDTKQNQLPTKNLTIRQYEEKLAEIKGCRCLQIWQIVEDYTAVIKWRAIVTVRKGHAILVKFLCPVKLNASCLFYRRFGTNRFLSVVFQGELDYCIPESFFKDGIRFGDMMFTFLCGKIIDSNKRKVSQTDGNFSAFESYFFAEKACPNISLYSFEEISIETVYAELGDFSSETNMAKMNIRLMLGFSPTFLCSSILGKSITVTKDLYSADGNIMTDGCGFIHSSLVDSVPFAISSGVSRYFSPCGEYSRKRMGQPLPLILQVRLVCHLGLFKGCLIVTNDESLCKANSVVLRHSMLKRESVTGRYDENSLVHIAVCNTFESEVARYEQIPSERFNKFFVLLFECLCDPASSVDQIFFELVDGELIDFEFDRNDKKSAISILRRCTSAATVRLMDALLDEDDEDGYESDTVETAVDFIESEFHPNLAMKKRSYNNIKFREAIEMIEAGFDLNEPRLQQVFSDAFALCYKRLKNMKFRMQHCMYAVGAPDPFGDHVGEELQGELREGEVFIVHPRDRSSRIIIEEGDVVVTRNPATHPGDVRKLKAVRNSRLEALVEPTSCGIIIFSVEGKRSAADMMGGGDFDGDEYFILLSKNRLVPLIVSVEPFEDSPRIPSQEIFDEGERGFRMMKSLCIDASKSLIGKYANIWLATADRFGPKSETAKNCDRNFKLSLDACKTGILLPSPDESILFPHYLESSDKPKYISESLVGKLVDRVSERINKRESSICKLTKLNCDSIILQCVALEEEAFWRDLFFRYNEELTEFRISKHEKDLSTIVNRYRSIFNNRSKHLAIENPSPPMNGSLLLFGCQLHLAATIYKITYNNAQWDEETGKHHIDFCWEICGRRIIDLKRIHKLEN